MILQAFRNIPSLEQSSTVIYSLEFAREFTKTAMATATETSLNKIKGTVTPRNMYICER